MHDPAFRRPETLHRRVLGGEGSLDWLKVSGMVAVRKGSEATSHDEALADADRHHIGSLLKGLSILDAFSAEASVLAIGELATRLHVSKSSASRLAATLETAGYLERVAERGHYRLGPKLVRLGELARGEQDLRQVTRPVLVHLAHASGETAHLGIRDGTECVTIDFVEGTHTVRMTTSVGKRGLLYTTSIGKCLLAWLSPDDVGALMGNVSFVRRTAKTITNLKALNQELQQVRKQGFAVDMEEVEPRLACIGAPIFDSANNVVAAISISGPTSRVNGRSQDAFAKLVKAAASEATKRLGGRSLSLDESD